MLWWILKRRIGTILDSEFFRSLWKTSFASLVMLGVIIGIDLLFPWRVSGPFTERLVYLVLCVIGGIVAFFMAAFLGGSPEIAMMQQSIRRRISSRSRVA
jgi:hypothetical protein